MINNRPKFNIQKGAYCCACIKCVSYNQTLIKNSVSWDIGIALCPRCGCTFYLNRKDYQGNLLVYNHSPECRTPWNATPIAYLKEK